MSVNKNFLPEQLSELKDLYESFKNFGGYELNRENFEKFSKTGNRLDYENEYFSRRGCLISRAMTRLIYGGHKNELEKIIAAICDEFTWALPAHIGDSKTPETVIDLFNAETAQTLSEICAVCDISGTLKERVKSEITRRVIAPYETETFHWETSDHNWAAVCGGCVGMTYMSMFPERFPAVRDRLLKTMDCFLSGYGNDGICLEGADYWGYGFGYFVCFAEMLERFDGTNLLDNEKVKKIAQCREHMFLRKNTAVSFSDCPREIGFNFGLTCFLENRFGETEIPALKYRRDFDGCYRWALYYRSFVWGDTKIKYGAQKKYARYFPSAEWYIDKRGKFSFAAKGGCNSEPHNHNDIGSFIIADDTGQLIADLGAGEYTADYFGDKRYEDFHTSSLGHSVPVIDGALQGCGKAVSRAENGVFSTDITDAYAVSELKKLERAFRVSDNKIVISDSFSFENGGHKITERLVSLIKPEKTSNGIKLGALTVECAFAAPHIEKKTVKNHHGLTETVYTTDFIAVSREKSFTLTLACFFGEKA